VAARSIAGIVLVEPGEASGILRFVEIVHLLETPALPRLVASGRPGRCGDQADVGIQASLSDVRTHVEIEPVILLAQPRTAGTSPATGLPFLSRPRMHLGPREAAEIGFTIEAGVDLTHAAPRSSSMQGIASSLIEPGSLVLQAARASSSNSGGHRCRDVRRGLAGLDGMAGPQGGQAAQCIAAPLALGTLLGWPAGPLKRIEPTPEAETGPIGTRSARRRNSRWEWPA